MNYGYTLRVNHRPDDLEQFVFNQPLDAKQHAELVAYGDKKYGMSTYLRQLTEDETTSLLNFAIALTEPRNSFRLNPML